MTARAIQRMRIPAMTSAANARRSASPGDRGVGPSAATGPIPRTVRGGPPVVNLSPIGQVARCLMANLGSPANGRLRAAGDGGAVKAPAWASDTESAADSVLLACLFDAPQEGSYAAEPMTAHQAGPSVPGGRLGRAISIVELIATGTLDAEMAGVLWLLLEARVPIVVAATAPRTGKTTLLEALLAFLPVGTRRRQLAGFAEDFDWLPEAAELGWRSTGDSAPRSLPAHLARDDRATADPSTSYLV